MWLLYTTPNGERVHLTATRQPLASRRFTTLPFCVDVAPSQQARDVPTPPVADEAPGGTAEPAQPRTRRRSSRNRPSSRAGSSGDSPGSWAPSRTTRSTRGNSSRGRKRPIDDVRDETGAGEGQAAAGSSRPPSVASDTSAASDAAPRIMVPQGAESNGLPMMSPLRTRSGKARHAKAGKRPRTGTATSGDSGRPSSAPPGRSVETLNGPASPGVATRPRASTMMSPRVAALRGSVPPPAFAPKTPASRVSHVSMQGSPVQLGAGVATAAVTSTGDTSMQREALQPPASHSRQSVGSNGASAAFTLAAAAAPSDVVPALASRGHEAALAAGEAAAARLRAAKRAHGGGQDAGGAGAGSAASSAGASAGAMSKPGPHDSFSAPFLKSPVADSAQGSSQGYKFYPGSGESDNLDANVVNCPVVPLWRERRVGGKRPHNSKVGC